MDKEFLAKGETPKRLRSILFLLPAWFAPHTRLRVFFHRLRGVRIAKNVEIGYFCIIGNVHPHMIKLEEGAVVSGKSVILEHDNAYYYARGGKVKFGPVVIEEKAFIGLNCVVMPGVTIGARSIIGAGSVVTKNIPPDSVAAGSPAKIIKICRPEN